MNGRFTSRPPRGTPGGPPSLAVVHVGVMLGGLVVLLAVLLAAGPGLLPVQRHVDIAYLACLTVLVGVAIARPAWHVVASEIALALLMLVVLMPVLFLGTTLGPAWRGEPTAALAFYAQQGVWVVLICVAAPLIGRARISRVLTAVVCPAYLVAGCWWLDFGAGHAGARALSTMLNMGIAIVMMLYVASVVRSLREQLGHARDQSHALAVAASTDPLTGLTNRRTFERACQHELAGAGSVLGVPSTLMRPADDTPPDAPRGDGVAGGSAQGDETGSAGHRGERGKRSHEDDAAPATPVRVLVLMDLDHFKQINDEHGHAVGDQVLARVGELIRRTGRPDELAARWGGEEFVFIGWHRDQDGALDRIEHLRLAMRSAAWPAGIVQNASFGLTVIADDDALEHAIARADGALYRAKTGGRDTVRIG